MQWQSIHTIIHLPHWYSGQHSPSFCIALHPGFVGQKTILLGTVWPSVIQISKSALKTGYLVRVVANQASSPLLGLVSFLIIPLFELIAGVSSPFVSIRFVLSYTGPARWVQREKNISIKPMFRYNYSFLSLHLCRLNLNGQSWISFAWSCRAPCEGEEESFAGQSQGKFRLVSYVSLFNTTSGRKEEVSVNLFSPLSP